MPGDNRTQIIVGCLALVGVVGGAVIANWDKLTGTSKDKTASSATPNINQTQHGDNNVAILGSNNVVNPPPIPKPCRDKSHGVESYSRTFDVDRTSPWMGGGFSQDPWCNQVIGELRGQNPDGQFEVISKSETSKTTCAPLNCPQYQYFCRVHVKTDPVYFEKLSAACK